ncbi:MAG: NAD(P)/FAD-dependent oxidoreductase [Actinomycetota bacterium]|nr:NAD(P)/FAD-dependent oxidoreductase [Actinomycetota bacterium]
MYDVIVVGSGPAGLLTAWKAAEAGAKVLILESREEGEVGGKVSFDSVTPNIFEELDIPAPSGEELDEEGRYLKVVSPDKTSWVEFEVPNYLVHRGLLGKRLLGYAQEAGAEFREECKVTGPILREGGVAGVICEIGGKTEEIEARVTADCSGFFAVVRIKLPPEIFPPYRLARENVVAAYREIRPKIDVWTHCPPDNYPGYFDFLGYHGGYLWIVREKEHFWNVGIGVLDLPDTPSAMKQVREFCDANPGVGDDIVKQGYGNSPYISLAGGLPRSVADGFMAVGEAAWQVCPATGYGVYGGMKAGSLAGPVAARAALAGDCSTEALWPYEVQWKRGYGSDFAFLDVLRKLVQSSSNEELDYLMKHGVLGAKELGAGWNTYTFTQGLGERLGKLARGWRRPSLLTRFSRGLNIARHLEAHSKAFPERPEDFKEWAAKRKELYDNLHDILDIELHPGGYEEGWKTWER